MLANFDLTTAVQFDIKEMYPGTNAHRERKIIDKGSVVSYKFLCMIVVFIFCFLFKVDRGRYDNSEKFKYRASGWSLSLSPKGSVRALSHEFHLFSK